MRVLWAVLLFSSCAIQRSPEPSDTIIDSDKRNWLKIYAAELRAARHNGDIDAWVFFWPEYLEELEKSKNNVK